MKLLFSIALAYCIGSVPFALIVGKVVSGVDIRHFGSGNLGGTNAYRVLGWKVGIPVIAADILKGAIATYIGFLLGGDTGGIMAGMAAAFGHCYPLFAGFKGGKGVAVGAGVFLVLAPKVIMLAAVTFTFTLAISKYVSLASLMGALTVAVLTWTFQLNFFLIVLSWILVLFLIYRHRSNIQRILNGTENKVSRKKK